MPALLLILLSFAAYAAAVSVARGLSHSGRTLQAASGELAVTAMPETVSRALAWNNWNPLPVVSLFAPAVPPASEDRVGTPQSASLGVFQERLAAGYEFPARPGISAGWQPGKALYLAWFVSAPPAAPSVVILAAATGFGWLQGVSALHPD
jgi:hypothetical protein